MEWMEHHSGNRAERIIEKAGRAGPAFAALLGLLPQCAFSASLSGLYSGRIITAGTLMAVFLATSDEMIPVFLSSGFGVGRIFVILAVKFAVAAAAGFIVDLVWRTKSHSGLEAHCDKEGCHCHEKGIVRSAFFHTVKVFAFIFALSFVIHTALELVGEQRLSSLFLKVPVFSNALAALVGLIPNCASSVIIAQMYLEGIMSAGAMMSGLFVGAGTGLLVLFRVNRPRRDTLVFTLVLFLVGTVSGILLDLVGLEALLR